MAEAVAGLLTSGFVKIATAKLGSAIGDQASLLWNFTDDLEGMKNVLEIISEKLEDAERRSIKENRVQLLLKRLKDVALDISDVLEDYQDTRDQATAKNPGVLSCIPTAYKKIAIANRMKSLRKELMKIKMEFGNFESISTQGTSTNVQLPDKRVTTSYFLPEKVEGREGEKQEIINMLLHARSNHDESETVIVHIYALGGMGKTTLAQLVYVSQDFNLLKIGNSIISQLQREGAHQNRDLQNTDLQVIMDCLDNLLCNKKVLIVLDDLWETDDDELSKLKNMLRVGKKGSTIDVIVTTREEGIAKKVSTSKLQPLKDVVCLLYKLQPLKDVVCWEIIKRSSKCNQKEFEMIGLDIAKKCGGVPLAAQALGGMLQSKDLSEWTNINDSDIWNETSNHRVLPSLKLSYHRMPQQLRMCFSYCAIFSKGHSIVEHDLIHQWSVLGFIERKKGKEYIEQLLRMSFLEVSKIPSTSQEQVVRYTMHDLVHDLARLTMVDELIDFTAQERNTLGQKYCRYLLLNYDQTMKLASTFPSKIRLLRFSDSGELDIQSGAFSFANCLRALGFCECSGTLFPASIGQLKHLRCFIAPRMQNESLPECITELSKLQHLNINGSSQIRALPESIGKLGCLQYICLSGCSGISKLPESFCDLKCMVHLDMSGCSGIKELPDSLGKLRNLQHLDLSGCSSVKAIPEPLCGLTQLQYLNMSDCEKIRELPESLMNLQNLLHLDLSCCTKMRHLGGVRGLTTLQHLNMSRVWVFDIGLQDLSDVLANLTNLKYLGLSNSIIHGRASYVFPYGIGGLTNLEHLDLSYNYNIACLPESIGNLKRLHTLDLTECSFLKSLPESLGTLGGLKSLLLDGCSDKLIDQASSVVNYSPMLPIFWVCADEVNGCSNLHLLEGVHVSVLRIHSLENVRSLEEANKVKLSDKHNLSELTLAWSTKRAVQTLEDKDLLEQLAPPTGLKSMYLKGYSCTSFPGWLMDISRHLTNLVYIRLQDLPKCSNLPPLGQFRHLEKLSLRNLPGIKRIDREFCGGKGAFRRLSSFHVSKMDGLEEWNTTYSVEEGVEEFMFPVLDSLTIDECPRLRLKPCPPTFHECYIEYSDKVISSLEVDKTNHHCSSSSPAIKLDLTLSGDSCIRLFHHFPLLRELTITGGDYLTNVPESMRSLTSLESLTLQCCYGISALPEWLGDLSSLKSLVIVSCSIMSLPASIQQLTKLQKLEIRYCTQELKEWCESEENKAKLAHINNFQVFEEQDSDSESPSCDSVSPPNLRPVNTQQNSTTPPLQPATAPSALALPWYVIFLRKLWYGIGGVPDVAAVHEPGPELPVTGLVTDTTTPVPERASAFATLAMDGPLVFHPGATEQHESQARKRPVRRKRATDSARKPRRSTRLMEKEEPSFEFPANKASRLQKAKFDFSGASSGRLRTALARSHLLSNPMSPSGDDENLVKVAASLSGVAASPSLAE
ncbi:unnamed protein product [Miscanthus lutarioriparius]|uniref:Uncharacterized protein n=1 Tax=Miscanthus lutarioriparius TaxID=422564 RepID=A0A811Q256_9POAL|nr:unnamed protein product [Miscanthus lutarioriparius]